MYVSVIQGRTEKELLVVDAEKTTQEFQTESYEIGKAFFNISQKVDGIRMQTINCSNSMDTATVLIDKK